MEMYNDINQAKAIAKRLLDNFKNAQKAQYPGLLFSAKISQDRVEITLRNPTNNANFFLQLARHSQTKGTPEQVLATIIADFKGLGVVQK